MQTHLPSRSSAGRSASWFALSAVLLVFFSGCVKFKHALTLKPDGSGKVEITFGMAETMLAHQDGDEFALASLDELIGQEDRGFVAFGSPETWSEDGFTYQRIVGYFEDVTQLVIEGDEDLEGNAEAEPTTFAYDDNGTLTISRCLLQQVALETDDASEADPAKRAAMAAMMSGLHIEESVSVPGEIDDAGPFAVQGDTARAAIDEAALLDDDSVVLNTWRNTGGVTVTFKPRRWSRGEKDAWQQELEAAKTAWEAIKAAGSLSP